VAGYYQGWVDGLVMRLADVTLAFPTLLLLIAVAAAVRPSLPVVFVVIGAMVADGRDLLRVAPWVSFAPGIAIGMAVLGFNLVGDGLREAFDPRLRSER
jgi:ABC-type dipeptide/oligopeptide/nickel transport system permease subunit